jgi:thiosulfate dehydrogenase [quinone] large subunit
MRSVTGNSQPSLRCRSGSAWHSRGVSARKTTPVSRSSTPPAATTVPGPDFLGRFREPGWAVLPLRLFLGVTFVYAGLLKLTDPSYLDPNAPQGVHQQMLLQAKTSPIGSVVAITAHHAAFFGILIAIGEIAVGLGAILGAWTRLAALGGVMLAGSFWLTVSWHTHPYFFGSDIVFVFGWLTLLLLGDSRVLSLVAVVRRRTRIEMGLAPVAVRDEPTQVLDEVDRRTVVRTAGIATVIGLVTVVFGSVIGWLRHGSYTPAAAFRRGTFGTNNPPGGPSSGPTLGQNPSQTPSQTPTQTSAPGTAVMSASKVPVGGAAQFRDPTTGDPAYVVQPSAGQFVAFDAVCTHAGCPVGFDGSQFVCPCHGGTYSATTGQVTGGPPPAPLPPINVTVVNGEVRVV